MKVLKSVVVLFAVFSIVFSLPVVAEELLKESTPEAAPVKCWLENFIGKRIRIIYLCASSVSERSPEFVQPASVSYRGTLVHVEPTGVLLRDVKSHGARAERELEEAFFPYGQMIYIEHWPKN